MNTPPQNRWKLFGDELSPSGTAFLICVVLDRHGYCDQIVKESVHSSDILPPEEETSLYIHPELVLNIQL